MRVELELFQLSHQGNQFFNGLLGVRTISLDGDVGALGQTQGLQLEQALGTSRFAAADDVDVTLERLGFLDELGSRTSVETVFSSNDDRFLKHVFTPMLMMTAVMDSAFTTTALR